MYVSSLIWIYRDCFKAHLQISVSIRQTTGIMVSFYLLARTDVVGCKYQCTSNSFSSLPGAMSAASLQNLELVADTPNTRLFLPPPH
jgi:hypothetical protein